MSFRSWHSRSAIPVLTRSSQLLASIRRFVIPDGSSDYTKWRNRFIQQRLRLLWQLIIASKVVFAALESYGYLIYPQQYVEAHDIPYRVVMGYYGVVLLCLLSWRLGYRFQWSQQHSVGMFIGLSLITTLPGQFLGTLYHLANPDFVTWTLLFSAQALVIPVCWRTHALSQFVVLAYFLIVNSLLNFLVGDTPVYAYTLLWWWITWLYGICNLAVFLFEQLRQSDFESRRELQIFLHAVSHDLRTPSIGTSLVLQNLLKKPGLQITVHQSIIDRLIEGSDRQLALIDTLTYAHQVDKKMSLHPESLELADVVRSVLSDINEVLIQNQIQIINRIDPALPLVSVDRTQIWRVFNNLISNAANHNPPQTTLTLEAEVVEVQQPFVQSMLQCRVQDNGTGISPAQQQHLFELYSRGSRARYMKGLGLGLYLCRQIIDAHGGQIGVNSSPGEGSTFWFTLPLA